jgi:CMP-N-acetylneuraminic acid synthetase
MKPVPRVLAVVPARGGSKGIPRKNLADLGGRPLLAWTLQAAQASGVVDELIVSTDDAEIADVARQWGARVPFKRPAELGRDEVHAVHTVLHALDSFEAEHFDLPEVVLMLLPTSPLRRPEDIRACVELMDRHQAPAVVSVIDLGKYLNNLRYLDGDALSLVDPNVDRNGQRQTQRKVHAVNGSIFAARPHLLRAHGSFHIDGACGHLMAPCHSIDINNPQDLELARQSLAHPALAALAR